MPSAGDPYLDPDTGILLNLVGARTRDALSEAEATLTRARNYELISDPVEPTGDLHQLQEIHRRLFQDVFAWAGQLRTVEIRKSEDYFMSPSRFSTAGAEVFVVLGAENLLANLSTDDFVERLAFHFNELNYFHAFREGNGRTQRFFWHQIAKQTGHPLDWRAVDSAANIHASRAAMERGNLQPLRELISSALVPVSDLPASVRSRPKGDSEGTGSLRGAKYTRCSVCGRPLRSAESVARGFGPKCASKV